jgi:hypothetical protein
MNTDDLMIAYEDETGISTDEIYELLDQCQDHPGFSKFCDDIAEVHPLLAHNN